MKTIVISILGPDRAGIVDDISQSLMAHHGNWLGSSMSLMAGHFAGIVEANVPEAELASLQQALGQLANLTVHVADGCAEPSSTTTSLEFVVTANDRPGIVQQVSACLAQLNVNVLLLETECQPAAHFGGNLFQARIVAALPEGVDESSVWDALESLSDDLMLDKDRP
ncbi:glycine cleavage system protein R [Neiella marina]|uniref:Glycine cleavage system transcriptional repressor n=1 Tax=Neiella holothuriorum TaxID=2870530 RepID=A0ABS7EK37_9GAMM|nr:ACT domain-containing protein [Neiella holothuriorum]MBW8192714.1 glycine cleavage system protein R [Neiella holothuriorum]